MTATPQVPAMPGMTPMGISPAPAAPECLTFTLPASDVLHALERTRLCVSTEKTTRYYLTGVYVHQPVGKSHVAFCGTDGHRLSVVTVDGTAPKSAILAPDSVDSLIATLKKLKRQILTWLVEFDCTRADEWSANVASNKIPLKTIDGMFPDYQRLVPHGNDKIVEFQSAEFARACKALAGFAKGAAGTANVQAAARLSFHGAECTLSNRQTAYSSKDGDQPRGNATWALPLRDLVTAPFDIGFNVQYLLDYARGLDPMSIIAMHYAGAGSPTLFDAQNGETFVLMPIRA